MPASVVLDVKNNSEEELKFNTCNEIKINNA